MKNNLANLLKVKTIVTLLMVLAYIILAFLGKVDIEKFNRLVELIIIFYFGTQVGKKEGA